MGFEAVLGMYTLIAATLADPYQFPKPKNFLDYHKDAIGAVAWAYHSWRKIECNDQTLERAFSHPKTKASLDDLFVKDDGKIYAEIAGLISIDSDQQGTYLRFYTTKTINELFGDELLQTDNPLAFLKKNQKLYSDIVPIEPAAYSTALKLGLLGNLIHHYIYFSDNTALRYGSTYRQLSYEQLTAWSGRLVGTFHLHNNINPPSKQDTDNDPGTPSFVISRTTPYTFYRVFDQKATRISPSE